MQTKVTVVLNFVAMHTLDTRIVIQKVTELAPNWNINTAGKASLIGQRYVSTEKRYREVQVTFAIDEVQNLGTRMSVLQKVANWAKNGGTMMLGYRDMQRLQVVCTGFPQINGIDAWTENYTVTFRAYDKPFWEQGSPNVVTAHSANTNVTLNMSFGNDNSKLIVSATNNQTNVCNTLIVKRGTEQIEMSNLGLAAGETFILDYDERDIQRMRIRNGSTYRSVMDKRTAASADDIWVVPLNNSITVQAGAVLDWELSSYGRWID